MPVEIDIKPHSGNPMGKMGSMDSYGQQSGGEPDGDELGIGGSQMIPLKYLSQPDDNDQMQTPAVGDTGTMTVDYKVVSIDGDMASIRPMTINGNDVSEDENNPTPDDEDTSDEEGDALRGEAEQMSNPSDQGAS